MVIQHNIPAMNSYRNLSNNQSAIAGNLEKLSSGYQINRAGDNAAGLAVSEKMRAQITGLDAAQNNVADGISLVKTAEGALQEVHDMLNRMSELATLSANGTFDDEVDRAAYQLEVSELIDEIDRIADSTNFNGINLLDGTYEKETEVNLAAVGLTTYIEDGELRLSGETADYDDLELKEGMTVNIGGQTYTVGDSYNATSMTIASATGLTDILTSLKATGAVSIKEDDIAATSTSLAYVKLADASVGTGLKLQIGDTSDSYNVLELHIEDMSASGLGIDIVDIGDQDGASDAITAIKNAINVVSMNRATLGANQNRLEHTANNLSVMEENIQDAESTIRDTDVAEEMMEYTKNNILIQSAQSMLAQANQLPQGVLSLLG